MGSKEQLEIQVGQELDLDKWGTLGKVGIPGVFPPCPADWTADGWQEVGAQARAQAGEGRARTPQKERQDTGEKDGGMAREREGYDHRAWDTAHRVTRAKRKGKERKDGSVMVTDLRSVAIICIITITAPSG